MLSSQAPVRSICFICDWNEGRSVHLALVTKQRLGEQRDALRVLSAGLRQGGGISKLRREHLVAAGVPASEIDPHFSTVIGAEHAACDLLLVAERRMEDGIVEKWPGTAGKIVTVRGFVAGFSPIDEPPEQAIIVDAGGHTDAQKLVLYDELTHLAEEIVAQVRLWYLPRE